MSKLPTSQSTAFGGRFKDVRISLDMSQDELADVLSVKRQTLSSWEKGTSSPDISKLDLLKQHAIKSGKPVSLGELLGEVLEDSGPSPLTFTRDLLSDIDDMGLRGIFRNRGSALDSFAVAIDREVDSINLVSSSLTGVLRVASSQVAELLRTKAKEVRSFRLLMTDPIDFSPLRENQEGRREGSIRGEISENIDRLLGDWEVPPTNIRFYKGAPTVFLLFTSDRMLLNPYTYETEAYKTLTLEVAKTNNVEDIYSQFAENHFSRPWNGDSSVGCEEFLSQLREE